MSEEPLPEDSELEELLVEPEVPESEVAVLDELDEVPDELPEPDVLDESDVVVETVVVVLAASIAA